jgi:hypothetical protein
MKKKSIVLVSLLVVLLAAVWRTKAQIANSNPWQLTVVGTHTSCAVAVGQTNFCFASDGLWQSLNGAPYVQLTPSTPIGTLVTSVNGKTGAVVLAIQ